MIPREFTLEAHKLEERHTMFFSTKWTGLEQRKHYIKIQPLLYTRIISTKWLNARPFFGQNPCGHRTMVYAKLELSHVFCCNNLRSPFLIDFCVLCHLSSFHGSNGILGSSRLLWPKAMLPGHRCKSELPRRVSSLSRSAVWHDFQKIMQLTEKSFPNEQSA